MTIAKRWVAVMAVVAAMLVASGCASFQTTGAKVLITTTQTVDAAMKGWAAYVVANSVPETDQAKVRAAYGQYQLAETAAEKAYVAAVGTGNQTGWEAASAALSAASGSLQALVASLAVKQP